jgi:hypothetical protein
MAVLLQALIAQHSQGTLGQSSARTARNKRGEDRLHEAQGDEDTGGEAVEDAGSGRIASFCKRLQHFTGMRFNVAASWRVAS